MEIVLEKSQVVDLRLDLHKQGISIGDDLNLVVNDQDQFILYFEPEPPPLKWSAPIVRKAEDHRWLLRDPSPKRLS